MTTLEDFGSVLQEIRSALKDLARGRTTSSGPELLTVAEAAQLASVSVNTIRNWLKRGSIKRYGKGRLVRVRRDEVLDYLSSENRDDTSSPDVLARKILGR